MAETGEPAWRGRQLAEAFIVSGLRTFTEITTLPKSLRAEADADRLAGGPAADCAGLPVGGWDGALPGARASAQDRRRWKRSGCRKGTTAKRRRERVDGRGWDRGEVERPEATTGSRAHDLRLEPGGMRGELPVLPDGEAGPAAEPDARARLRGRWLRCSSGTVLRWAGTA